MVLQLLERDPDFNTLLIMKGLGIKLLMEQDQDQADPGSSQNIYLIP